MKLLRKINTAYLIFKNEGIVTLFKRTKTHLATIFDNTIEADETKIVFEILQAKQKKGIMLDVGAHFGDALASFAHCDWKIFAFEPDPDNHKKLVNYFGQFKNVIIDSRAVSDQIQQGVDFYTSKESTGISGLSSFHASHETNSTVDTTTLDHFLKHEKVNTVDFLKIDTEGYDLFVLKGFPWDKMKPEVIICEFEDSKTEPLGYNFQDLALFLQKKGYSLMVSEWYPIMKYGTMHDWRCFTEYPCDLHDRYAWGNIIAVKEKKIFSLLMGTCSKITKTKDSRWIFEK